MKEPWHYKRMCGAELFSGRSAIALCLAALLLALSGLFPSIASLGSRPNSSAALVAVSPSSIQLPIGGTGVVSIRIENASNLHGLQLRLAFDPSKVHVVDADPSRPGIQVGLGTILSDSRWGIYQNVADNGVGFVYVLAFLTEVGDRFDGSGSLLEVTFKGVTSGTSPLTLTDVVLTDPTGVNLGATTSNGAIVVLNTTLTPTPTSTPTVPRVVVSPSSGYIANVGMTTTVDIRVLGVTNLYGAEVHLTFDPTVVHVMNIITGTCPPPGNPEPYVISSISNTAGTIVFAVTQTASGPSCNGDGTLCTITFQARQQGISPVRFSSALLVDPYSRVIPSTTSDGEVIVGQRSTLVGRVRFEGRDTADWSCPLEVQLFEPGGVTPLYTFSSVVCDQSGTFTVTNIASGTYDIKVRDERSLWNVRRSVPITGGINTVNLGTIVNGDANQDNVINILDFSILATAYGKSESDPGYDRRADFNNSRRIDILDFSILATNYGRSGDVIITGP